MYTSLLEGEQAHHSSDKYSTHTDLGFGSSIDYAWSHSRRGNVLPAVVSLDEGRGVGLWIDAVVPISRDRRCHDTTSSEVVGVLRPEVVASVCWSPIVVRECWCVDAAIAVVCLGWVRSSIVAGSGQCGCDTCGCNSDCRVVAVVVDIVVLLADGTISS